MHKTAMLHGRLFFDAYVTAPASIVDIGAQDINGSLRSVAPPDCSYVGVDFATGKGVDVIINDPYALPFEDESFDVAVTSSCFEHSEFFWLSYLEVLRILRPSGLLYLNVPSNGRFHRHPVDCWRFYPDSGVALQNWARRNGVNALMLESFLGPKNTGVWNDLVAVFVKDAAEAQRYPRRIIDSYPSFTNARRGPDSEIIGLQEWSEDQRAFSTRLVRRIRRAFGREPD